MSVVKKKDLSKRTKFEIPAGAYIKQSEFPEP